MLTTHKISHRILSLCLRPTISLRFHSTNPFLYIQDYKKLNQEIKLAFDKTSATNTDENSSSSDDLVVDAIKSLLLLESPATPQAVSPESLETLNTLFSKDITLTPELLKRIFLLNLPTPLNLKIINFYYTKNPNSTISKEIALIPLRNAILNADFENSIKLTDVTVGHPNYIASKNAILKKGFFRLVGSSLLITFLSKYGVQEIINLGVLSPGWKHLGSINSMLLTYLINSSFFVTVVRFGRQLISSGGDYLTWQKGTFYTHWFRHADEMLFASKIVEADRHLNGGESNPAIINELCRTNNDLFSKQHTLQPGYTRHGEKVRLLEAKDDLEDLKLQAYWMSGGDEFEWVEPDQDPADLIWKGYLQKWERGSVGEGDGRKSLKWADEIIRE